MGLASRIIGFIVTTFVLAALYGFGCATMDFANGQHDPVASGRYAAAHTYGLFGVVTEEVNHNDAKAEPIASTSVARKIAAPYAVTADLSALLGGKLMNGVNSVFRTVDEKVKD